MNQSALNIANRDYFNKLITNSIKTMATYLPSEVDVALPDESGERDYVSRPMFVDNAMKTQYVKDYVDELSLFGDELIGRPLTEVFEGCVSQKENDMLTAIRDFNERAKSICTLIWMRVFTEIMYEKYPEIASAAQLNFIEQLYDRAYNEYYYDRDNDGYTGMDKDHLDVCNQSSIDCYDFAEQNEEER